MNLHIFSNIQQKLVIKYVEMLSVRIIIHSSKGQREYDSNRIQHIVIDINLVSKENVNMSYLSHFPARKTSFQRSCKHRNTLQNVFCA